MASFLRTITLTLVLSGLVLLAYWRLTLDQQAKAIAELQAIRAQLEASLAARQAMVDRLSRSRRIAHLQVTGQTRDSNGGIQDTRVLFIELDDNGAEVARQEFTVPGDVLFVDAWTIKFNEPLVAEGDPVLGRTLVLLRRIYSDRLAPKDGLPIDTPGAVPPGYAATDASRFEKRLWEIFWELATDVQRAGEFGVRVAQGEAVYKPVRNGQRFELIVDADGGMSLTPLSNAGEALSQAEK